MRNLLLVAVSSETVNSISAPLLSDLQPFQHWDTLCVSIGRTDSSAAAEEWVGQQGTKSWLAGCVVGLVLLKKRRCCSGVVSL